MAGRPRKSYELKVLQGTAREPEPVKNENPIGDPPEHLTEAEQATWHELVSIALPGVLTASDRIVLEMAAKELTNYRTSPEFHTARFSSLIRLFNLLGMSPADRQKVGATKDKKKSNPFAALDSK